ncbi:Prolactin regulatory element-binding protein [Trichinella pseudospiralis]|uniref:Prolactin regulatory element-binding protein n=1 Tax=Trichinella pseudospiralis TaxID=6337 RepID=A0A0V1FLD9_TRIPS|nr:Prolactin regulatory element-binding protein [Trichinella pseudospiralis]
MCGAELFVSTSFPMYSVRVVGDHHIVVAGGGGQAKSGVPNRVEVFGIDLKSTGPKLAKMGHINTGSRATMNMDVLALNTKNGEFILALGQEGKCFTKSSVHCLSECFVSGCCQLVQTSYWNLKSPNAVDFSFDQIHRPHRSRSSSLNDDTKRRNAGTFSLKMDAIQLFQTDFSSDGRGGGPFQKVVRFSPSGQLLLTGGADGHFRVWQYPTVRIKLDHNAHKDEIDDLDISCNETVVVTVGRNGTCYLWRIKDAGKVADLNAVGTKPTLLPDKYRYRFARFLKDKSLDSHHVLITCSVPVARSTKMQSCFLTKWLISYSGSTLICRAESVRACGNEVISTMAVSDCSQYLAFGTLGGSLIVCKSANLITKKVWKQAHSIFVTSLDFLPTNPPKHSSFYPLLSSKSTLAIVSVSADNLCQIHTMDSSVTCSWSQLFLILTALLNVAYFFMKFC